MEKGILGVLDQTNLNMSMDSSKKEMTSKSDPATLLQPGQVNNNALNDLTGNELIANEEFIKFLYDNRNLVNTLPTPTQAKALADQDRILTMENEADPQDLLIPTSQQAKSVVSKGKPPAKAAQPPKVDAQTTNSKEMDQSDVRNRTEELEQTQAILETLWSTNDLVFGFGDNTFQKL